MLLIPSTAQYTFVCCQIRPRDELGAPADPTDTRVTMAFSETRAPGDALTFHDALWQANRFPTPAQYWAICAIGSSTPVSGLGVGVWFPIVRIVSNPEVPDLGGEPFRIY